MVDIEVEGNVEVECECPHCKRKFKTTVGYSDTVDIDLSDFASDGAWHD